MSARTSIWRLRCQLRHSNGGVSFPQFLAIRAASTSSSSSSSETSTETPTEIPLEDSASPSAPGPTKQNGYNPPPIPISPLMDPNKYIKMSRRYTKLQRPKGNEPLSPREEALKTNPYARILATDVRNEVDFHRRLPSWLLIRFIMLRHPETDETYLIPDRIREGTEKRETLAQGRWAISNINLVKILEDGKRWRKLVGGYDIDSRNMIWRKDMAGHVLKLLRERVCVEMEKVVQRDVVEMPCDNGFVGCVLDWGIGEEGNEKQHECLVAVKGKATPLHHMRILLGDEMAMELQKKMKIPEETMRSGLLVHERTLKAQMWLMRIRAYLCIW